MLNITNNCGCGAAKKQTNQWCSTCWELMTPDKRSAFTHAARHLFTRVKECDMQLNQILHGDAEEGQPCL